MLKANFKVDPILEKVKRMVTLAGDLRPVLLKIRGQALNTNTLTIIGGIGAQFVTQGAFYGTTWPDLKPEYARKKLKKFPGQTMLRATNKLLKAATMPGEDGNVEVLTYTSIAWGIADDKVPYAKFHMTGTKTMRERKFLGITKNQQTTWSALIKQYILETAGAA